MNLKTTLALLVLAACAAGLFFARGPLSPRRDVWERQSVSAEGESSRDILATLTVEALQKIDVRQLKDIDENTRVGAAVSCAFSPTARLAGLALMPLTDPASKQMDVDQLTLRRTADGSWVMPGNWPTRRNEVASVVGLLSGLNSRFEPVPLTDENRFGTDAPSVVVVVETSQKKVHTLTFSQDKSLSFDRPTYLRVDQHNEVLRLAPGLLATLERSSDYFLQRRLLPSERELREEGATARVDRLAAKKIVIEEKDKTRFVLERKAGGWEMTEPSRDALDPSTRDKLLEAAAELWAEKFVSGKDDDSVGLQSPERRLTVTRSDDSQITLHIGKVAEPPPPMLTPMPAARKATHFARIAGYNSVFEIGGNLDAIFVQSESLRDAQLARFTGTDAREVELTTSKGTVVLRGEEKKRDTPPPPPQIPGQPPPPPQPKTTVEWSIVQPIQSKADSALVEKLLTSLSGAQAQEKDSVAKVRLAGAIGVVGRPVGNCFVPLVSAALDQPAKLFGLHPSAENSPKPAASIKVSVEEGKREGGPKTKKTFVVHLGRHDKSAKRLYATSQDWPRVNEINDDLADLLLDKGALDYRGKRLLEFATGDVSRIETNLTLPPLAPGTVGLATPASMAVLVKLLPTDAARQRNVSLQRGASGWEMLAPVKAEADGPDVDALIERLSKLDVVAWVAPEAKADAAKYGLLSPALRATVSFKDAKKPARTLLVGNRRENDAGYYAKLEDAPEVFALPDDIVAQLGRDSLEYRPAQLWAIGKEDNIVRMRIAREGQAPYTLEKKGEEWEVSGPFTVKAPKMVIDRLTKLLSTPRAQTYRTHATTDFAPYGLDKPGVQLTLTTKEGKEHSLWLGSAVGDDSGRFGRLGEKSTAVVVIPDLLAKAADQSALDFLDRELLKFNPDQVSSFAYKKGNEEMELKKQDDAWQLVKPSAAGADDERAAALCKVAAGLRAERIAAYDPKDLTSFGLDKPTTTVTITLAGDKPTMHVLNLGAEVKDKAGSRYAQLKGSPLIGEVSAESVNRLLAGPLTYRDHLVAKLPDAETIKLEQGDRKLTFAKPEGTWKLTAPLTADADHDGLEAYMNTLARLRAHEFVAEKATPEQLKTWGLDKPAARWQFLVADQVKLDLVIGGVDSTAQRRYAKLFGSDVVFVMEPKLSTQTVTEYRPRAVFAENIDPARIDAVKFGHKKDAFELTKKDNNWEVAGKPDAKIDAKLVADSLAVLRDLKLERFIVDEKAQMKLFGLDPPELVLEFTVNDKTHALHIGGLEGGSKRRYARVPGTRTDVFVLSEEDSAKLFRELSSLLAK